MNRVLVSNLVGRMLLGRVNLLLRVPVDVRAVVVTVGRVLELSYNVLLVCSSHVWLAERRLIV